MAETGNRARLAPTLAAATSATATDTQTTEQKMRRALGLNAKSGPQTPQQRPEQARARHRFVQDGGVPVTVLNPRHDSESAALRERIADLEHQLDFERQAHAAARRSLAEQQSACQALETRLVHADLAHQDALAQERQLRMAAQAAASAQAAATAAQASVSVAPRRAAKAEPVAAVTEPKAEPRARKAKAEPPAVPKKRGRPRINPLPEPKAVRWWTPSFRAKR